MAVVGFLFLGVFPLGPYRGWKRDESFHYVLVTVVFLAAVLLPGTVLNFLLWPRIFKIAGFVVVAVAFYFGLKARANPLCAISYFTCSWFCIFGYFQFETEKARRLKFEDQKLRERGLDPEERDRPIGPP